MSQERKSCSGCGAKTVAEHNRRINMYRNTMHQYDGPTRGAKK